MPSYFYHLKLELYPYSADSTSTKSRHKTKTEAREPRKDIYLPPAGSDIFSTQDWPAHKPLKTDAHPRIFKKDLDRNTSSGSEGDVGDQNLGRKSAVIDCGPSRAERSLEIEAEHEGIVVPISKNTNIEFPAPRPGNIPSDLQSARKDWRFDRVRIESVDMIERAMAQPGERRQRGESSSHMISPGREGINAALTITGVDGGRGTKARFEAIEKGTEVGWGVIHLYRDGEETFGLGAHTEVYPTDHAHPESDSTSKDAYDDCTVICIPAVPSYLTPSDFLGFVGEKTTEDVSHIRMVMTGRMNRYLVLMKFRTGSTAKMWKKEFDGKVFNSMEPETCQVIFVKTITVQTPTASRPNTSFPELSHDPFTPSSASTFLKPFPPPTPNLVELPTCPVCLERMDDTTGLLTILCQHVFHCDCLQKWRGSGCPVCRHTNPSLGQQSTQSGYEPSNPPFGSGEASLCSVCDTTDDLWICLVCGNVGCGRYKGGHAKEHWKESAHNFALEIATQHVWDYAGDMWVHRLIRDKGDSKVIELPASSRQGLGNRQGGHEDMDMVPREKLENIGTEYTHLLTSQLDSQRVYFEELVNKAVSKASAASAAAASASSQAAEALEKLHTLSLEHAHLKNEVIPSLERDLEREKTKAAKSAEVARGFGRSLMEEKKVSEGLMERIGHVNKSMLAMSEEMTRVKAENEELKESNRDLLFSISAEQKIKEMGQSEEGVVGQSGLEGGTLSLPPEKKKPSRKGKGKS